MSTNDLLQDARSDTVDGRRHRPFVVAVTGLLIFALWLWPLHGSLWIDELGTWWVVKDSLGEAVDRALTYHGQSPMYYAVAWAVGQVAGPSETALRAPSVIAGFVSLVLLYRLLRRLADVETAWLGAVAYVGLGGVAFAVTDARPYAFGLAATVGAALALVRWLDDAVWRWGVAFVGLAVVGVWAHYMFLLVIPAFVGYAIVRVQASSTSVGWGGPVASTIAMGLGIAPLALQVASLWDRRGGLAVANLAEVGDLLIAWVPPVLVGGIVLGLLLARTQGPLSIGPGRLGPAAPVLVAAWLLFPPLALFVASWAADLMLLVPRYYVCAAPAAAMGFAMVVRRVEPSAARRIIVIVFAMLTVLVSGGTLKNGQDWRAASAFERTLAGDATPVLIHPALIESRDPEWLDDPERRSYLLSPIAFYPFAGRPILLPYTPDASAEAYLSRVADELADEPRFLIVTDASEEPFASWFDGRLGSGWTSRVLGRFGTVEVIAFTRGGAEPPPS